MGSGGVVYFLYKFTKNGVLDISIIQLQHYIESYISLIAYLCLPLMSASRSSFLPLSIAFQLTYDLMAHRLSKLLGNHH